MDLSSAVILIVAGIGGGMLSSLVGGAALVTYPTLLAIGLSPVTAMACNIVALTPSNFLAALYDRGRLPPFDRAFVGLIAVSLISTAIGAAALLITPERVFAYLIPVLMAFATVLFAFSARISAWLRAHASETGARPWTHSMMAIVPVSFYGGYFGAGVGVLLLGVLSVGTSGDYRTANTTKNLITSLGSLTTAVILIGHGAVRWVPALTMLVGALIGAFMGVRLAQVLPHAAMRVVVIVVGALLTVTFAWRYWL